MEDKFLRFLAKKLISIKGKARFISGEYVESIAYNFHIKEPIELLLKYNDNKNGYLCITKDRNVVYLRNMKKLREIFGFN